MGSSLMTHLHALGGGIAGYVIPFLFVLSIVVFFHELGHFLVARWCGVRVLVFSIGFGPEIVGFNDRHGTRWKISAIPLGGFVKFFGDDNVASASNGAQLADMDANERTRELRLSAGAQARGHCRRRSVGELHSRHRHLCRDLHALRQADDERAGRYRAAGQRRCGAGFQPGDLVTAINGATIESFADMQRVVSESAGETLSITVERNGVQRVLKAAPALKDVKDTFGNVRHIGILGISRSMAAADLKFEPVPPPRAVWMGVQETWFVVDRTLSYLAGVIVGREAADQLGGPIRIAQMSGQVATIGFVALIHLAAVLSVSIGLLNLFPIPLLDGGHLLFYSIEALRGRPLSERAQEVGFRIGLAIVLMLMIFATFNDIVHLTTS